MRYLKYLLVFCLGSIALKATTEEQHSSHAANDVLLRVALLGDAEPKPKAEFPGMASAVADINALAEQMPIEFVVGVGDIAHKGTLLQYVNASPVLRALRPTFYPIMGNEEHGSTVERFLEFSNFWNEGKTFFDSPKYVIERESVAWVFASPDFSRDFNDEGIGWMLRAIRQLHPKPVFLVVHGAQAGAYAENPDKGIHHPEFSEVLEQENLIAVISGDLHMDMDRSNHSKAIDGIHYLHIPALERTKLPDATQHTPMFRTLAIHKDGLVTVETYIADGSLEPLERHHYSFVMNR